MRSYVLILSVFLIILLAAGQPGYCEYADNQQNLPAGEILLNGIPSSSPLLQNATIKPEHQELEFNYREFTSSHRLPGPHRELRRSGGRNSPRRDLEVEIDFDDRDVGTGWGNIVVLHNDYDDLGVNFRGQNDRDGGGVINEEGNFGVNGHSSPNFLAFNTGGRYPNGGIPRPPEFIIFDTPVEVVTLMAGARNGGQVTMTAFDADDEEIAETNLNMQANMQELTVEQAGIAYVVINTNNAVFVLDDLYFASLAVLEISPEAFDLVVPVEEAIEEILTVGNSGEGDLNFEIEIIGEGSDWLSCDPNNGTVEPDEETEVSVIINTENLEPGEYDRIILINSNDSNRPELEIPVHIFAVIGSGQLSGVVFDVADDEPLEGVHLVLEGFDYEADSDENGEFDFGDIPVWAYTLIAVIDDYLPYIDDDVVIEVNEETVLEIGILHSTCEPDPDRVAVALAPDQDIEIELAIRNRGNGPLTYAVDRRLPGEADVDPWDLRQSIMAGQDREDSRIQGVVFAGDNFYVAGAHNNEPAIYIFSREGEYIDLFIQPGQDRYGMKDIACDGELIWGAIGSTIYGFALNGEVQLEFEAPIRSIANTAWDTDHQWLWISGITTDIVALDLEGNQPAEIDRGNLRIYGLAYYPDDPDDHPLYIYAKEPETNRAMLHKANPEDGDIVFITYLDPELGGSPQGTFITNQYDGYSWVFMAVANTVNDEGGDRVDVWHIDAHKDWIQIEPVDGVIDAGETQEFELTLDAAELPVGIFEAELVYIHDGVGGETQIPVTLAVVEGPVQAQRTIQLEMGWNMVSVNLQPDPDDIRVITHELVEADLLILLKDGVGRFYSPEFDFCNILGWNVADGYQIKMDEVGELTLEGITVMADDPIPLTEGWNLISYYPRTPVDAIVAFSGIEDRLLIAKDGVGRFYNPEWGFSNMGDLQELRGYQVKVSEDVELVYRLQAEDDDFIVSIRDRQGRLPVHPNTGSNMSLLLIDDRQSHSSFPRSSVGTIGVYADDKLVGSGVLENGICGIAVWGDDPTTTEIDGALVNESLELSLLSDDGLHPIEFNTLIGDGLYLIDGFWAVELLNITEIPNEFGIVSAYPNPFNNQTRVTYNLPESSYINLALFDLSGRCIESHISAYMKAGKNTILIDGSSYASGVYIFQLEAAGEISRIKIAIMK